MRGVKSSEIPNITGSKAIVRHAIQETDRAAAPTDRRLAPGAPRRAPAPTDEESGPPTSACHDDEQAEPTLCCLSTSYEADVGEFP